MTYHVMEPISASDLEWLVRRPLSDYDVCSDKLNGIGHGVLPPTELFERMLDRGIRSGLSPLSRIGEGPYQSGEIWLGAFQTVFLYLGKTPDMKDVLIELGGDSVGAGNVHVCRIGEERYHLIERIFP